VYDDHSDEMPRRALRFNIILGSERRVDLSFSTSLRVKERRGSSRKLLNELCGRIFIIS